MPDKVFNTEFDARHNLTYLGESILARNEQGNLKRHIMTLFPRSRFMVTEPSTLHGDQCAEYIDYLNSLRAAENVPSLTEEQKEDVINHAVALTIIEGEDGRFFAIIRPDPNNMQLAFQADEIMQKLLPKFRIFFMHTDDKRIRKAIRERGESWRIQPLPRTKDGMQKTVANNKITIRLSQRRIYYYNMQTGARFLSYESFERLNELDFETLRDYLIEIQTYSPMKNREGYSEIVFFKAGEGFTSANFQQFDFTAMDEDALRNVHRQLCEEFAKALIDPLFKQDNTENWDWLLSMVSTISNVDKFSTEEFQMGLCEEFALKVNWLPGGRINEEGGIIKDPVYTMMDQMTPSEWRRYNDGIPQRILFTYVQESFLIEYANIGVLPPIKRNQAANRESESSDKPKPRRSVYIMQIKLRGQEERVYIIRVQKWDIGELLNEGKGLLESINRAENYTDYILNRRLACHLLNMKLPPSLKVRRFIEIYHGVRAEFNNLVIHNAFYERDYVPGIATNRLTAKYFQNPKIGADFSVSFARMLGETAAPNLIVGRSTEGSVKPIFDDGDEVLQLDENGMPRRIIVSEQPGTFVYYNGGLENQIADYAVPIIKRAHIIPNYKQAAEAYVDGFLKSFRKIQRTAEQYRSTFDDLPDHNDGSMFQKWHCVLDRLRDANPNALAESLHDAILRGESDNRNA